MVRHRLPGGDEPGPPGLPVEDWDTLVPYAAFLAGHARCSFRLEFWATLRAGTRDGWALPGLVALSPRVRWMLRDHLRHPGSQLALEGGPLVLFCFVAYAEFWHHEGLFWAWRYLWKRWVWDAYAEGRARQLLAQWLAWRQKARPKVKGDT